MRDRVLFNFVWCVEKLDKERRPVTFYNIRLLKIGLSSHTILDCLEYSKMLGFLSSRVFYRGKGKYIEYYPKIDWHLLREYVEHKVGQKIKENNKIIPLISLSIRKKAPKGYKTIASKIPSI